MEQQHAPEVVVALYDGLAETQAAMDELQAAGIAYPDIRMGAHSAGDRDLPTLSAATLPERFWSLQVVIDEPGRYGAEKILRKHQPLAVGRMPAAEHGRSDTDQGAIAWRHYVFESPVATAETTEAAGTTGTTGIINSGVFASGALAEGNPPARGQAGSHHRPASEQQQPTSDDRQPATSTDRSRPETELHE